MNSPPTLRTAKRTAFLRSLNARAILLAVLSTLAGLIVGDGDADPPPAVDLPVCINP